MAHFPQVLRASCSTAHEMSTPITYSVDAGKTTYHSSIAAKVFEMGQMKASNVNSFQLVVLIEACFHGEYVLF